jgi:hypothetical protein
MTTENEWGETEEADYAFDGENYDSESLQTGGGDVVSKEGWYHFEVADVKPELSTLDNNGNPQTPSVCLTMMVLQSVDGQSPAGSRLYHRIYVASKDGTPPKEGTVKSALRVAKALGLVELTEIDGREVTVVKGTKNTRIPSKIWADAKGRQIVANVKLEKGGTVNGRTYKDKYAIPFGEAFDPSDPAVATVQKNADCLALIGKTSAAPAAGQAKTTQPATAGAAPFDDEDLSDL